MSAIKQRQIDHKMSRACEVLYPAYQEKKYEYVAREGLAAINEFRAFDETHVPLRSTVEACCPVVCYAGQSYEKLGKPEIAMDLYRYIIRRGSMGMLPFTSADTQNARPKPGVVNAVITLNGEFIS